MYLVFSAVTSRPIALLATNIAFVFFCTVHIFSSVRYTYFLLYTTHIFFCIVHIFSSVQYTYFLLYSTHIFFCTVKIFSRNILTSSAQATSLKRSSSFILFWFTCTLLVPRSKAKLKRHGGKVSPFYKTILGRNISDFSMHYNFFPCDVAAQRRPRSPNSLGL